MANAKSMVEAMRSNESSFCRGLVAEGFLSRVQMEQAAERYRLGKSRFDWTVFWKIDISGMLREGRAIYYDEHCRQDSELKPQLVSAVLKVQFAESMGKPAPPYPHAAFDRTMAECLSMVARWEPEPCFFGEHLLAGADSQTPVAIVARERTAVICSARFPDMIWLASAGIDLRQPRFFLPLRRRNIIIFPEAPAGRNAMSLWRSAAQKASELLRQPVPVSERGIDVETLKTATTGGTEAAESV